LYWQHMHARGAHVVVKSMLANWLFCWIFITFHLCVIKSFLKILLYLFECAILLCCHSIFQQYHSNISIKFVYYIVLCASRDSYCLITHHVLFLSSSILIPSCSSKCCNIFLCMCDIAVIMWRSLPECWDC